MLSGYGRGIKDRFRGTSLSDMLFKAGILFGTNKFFDGFLEKTKFSRGTKFLRGIARLYE